LFIREDRKGGNAIQSTIKLDDGESCDIKAAEDLMKAAVERIADKMKDMTESTSSPSSPREASK
jgi:hypothetical protein